MLLMFQIDRELHSSLFPFRIRRTFSEAIYALADHGVFSRLMVQNTDFFLVPVDSTRSNLVIRLLDLETEASTECVLDVIFDPLRLCIPDD
jgi:hypothetical protein